MKKIISIVILTLFMASTFVYAKGERPFFLRGVRALGMGNAHIALSEDQNAFFYNPAGITKRKRNMLTMIELRASVSDDLIKGYNWLMKDNEKNWKDLQNYDELSTTRKEEVTQEIIDKLAKYDMRLTASVPNFNYISGPIGIKGQESFIGLGVFDEANIKFGMNPGLIVPTIDIEADIDAAGMFLIASKLSPNVSLGLNFKMLARTSVREERMSILTVENYEPMLQPGFGFGADLGVSWDPRKDISVGLNVTDIGATAIKYPKVEQTREDGTIRVKKEWSGLIYPRVNIGATYRPLHKLKNIIFFPDIIVAADIRDITDEGGNRKLTGKDILKNSHMGVELGWKFLALRGGFNGGYPCAGIGVSFFSLKADYAFYTDELGFFAGDKPESNHMISIAWRFGTTITRDKKEKKVKKIEKAEEKKEVEKKETEVEKPEEKIEAPKDTEKKAEEVKPEKIIEKTTEKKEEPKEEKETNNNP